MDLLLGWIKKSFKTINDFEVAFQSPAQFEIIHSFVDGNGRVGRLLINWILMYKGYCLLSIAVKNRGTYILALEDNRSGNLKSLTTFCFKEYLSYYQFV